MTTDTHRTSRSYWPWVLAGLGTLLVPPLGLPTIALYLAAKRLDLKARWLNLLTPAAFVSLFAFQAVGFDVEAWADAWPPQDTNLGGVLLAAIQSGIAMLVWAGPLAATTLWASRQWGTRSVEEGLAKLKTALAPKPVPALIPVAATGASATTAPPTEPVSGPPPSLAAPPEEIRLGTDAVKGQPTGLYPNELQQHGLLLGATGSGKTTTLLKIGDGAAALGIPLVAIDLKGSPGFASQLERIASRHGRDSCAGRCQAIRTGTRSLAATPQSSRTSSSGWRHGQSPTTSARPSATSKPCSPSSTRSARPHRCNESST
ncbi:MAG TPA: helicase HerA-like domain-containing protein [Solirubrobacterales bacterium]|nr:helicase HerA-like domain-containing protein [Solirubrobacterales bacterium]